MGTGMGIQRVANSSNPSSPSGCLTICVGHCGPLERSG